VTYASKHDYIDIVDAGFKLLLHRPLADFIPRLSPHLIAPWVRLSPNPPWVTRSRILQLSHYEKYNQVLRNAMAYYDSWNPQHKRDSRSAKSKSQSSISPCQTESKPLRGCRILRKLGDGVGVLMNLNAIFHISDGCCVDFTTSLATWREAIEKDMEKIPPFHTLL
jgi:hypothetical protein